MAVKFPKNWQQKSLEVLENHNWGDPSTAPSNLVKRCMLLSKIPVEGFTLGDLRVMIGQGFGLPYLVPIAIERLKDDIFVDAELYEGDLLNSVLRIDTSFWIDHEIYWRQLNEIIGDKRQEIDSRRIPLTNFDNTKYTAR